jgi:energy-coupling factor transporter ATP-binding protein EcfA2
LFYLSDLTVRNFTSFRDVHDFRFVEGFNLIQGTGGSGKTNLVRALEFALFGKTRGRSTPSLISDLHRRDCEKRGTTPDCEVSAVFRCDRRDLTIKRMLLDSMDGLKQTVMVDSEFIDMVSPERFDKMVIRMEKIEPLRGLSRGESIRVYVLNSIARNLCDGIDIVILDCIFCMLPREKSYALLSRLGEIGLEQIIMLEPLGLDRSLVEGFNANAVELQYPLCARAPEIIYLAL